MNMIEILLTIFCILMNTTGQFELKGVLWCFREWP